MIKKPHKFTILVSSLFVQVLCFSSRVNPSSGFQAGVYIGFKSSQSSSQIHLPSNSYAASTYAGQLTLEFPVSRLLFPPYQQRQIRKRHAVLKEFMEEEDSVGKAAKVGKVNIKETLEKCVLDRSVSADEVIRTLKSLEKPHENKSNSDSLLHLVNGTFELIFSSAVNIMGLHGYLPNREMIHFDFEARRMFLKVETFSFLPTIDIVGNDLTWYDEYDTLTYKVVGKKKQSRWKILYADDNVIAADSSVTGLNVLKRIQQ